MEQSKDLRELLDLGKELLTLAIEVYKEGGGDIKELNLIDDLTLFERLEPTKALLYSIVKYRSFEGRLKGYLLLALKGAWDDVHANDRDSLFKIYELFTFVDRLGLTFNKEQFLVLQLSVVGAFMTIEEFNIYHNRGTEEEVEYGNWKVDVALPSTLKLLQEMEELKKPISDREYVWQKIIKDIAAWFIVDDTATRTVREDYDPLTPLLPFLIEYGEIEVLDDCRECFDRMHAELLPWDRELQWVLLYLKGAEMLQGKDSSKGERCIERAKALIEKRFSTYFFSSNQSQWKEVKDSAFAEYQRVSELYNDLK